MKKNLSRRRFLTRTTATAVAVTGLSGATWFDTPDLFADTIAESRQKYGGFRMGLQSYSLRAFDVEKALQILQDIEIHYVEFYKNHFSIDSTEAEIKAMNKMMRKYGVRHGAHGVDKFTNDHAANHKIFQFAKNAGIKCISAMPDPDAYDSLDKLLAEFPDQRIAIHNHGPGHAFDKISDVEKAIEGHHPHLGSCADLGHFIRSGEDPVEVVERLAGRTFGVHLKDFKSTDAASPDGKHAEGCILGEGVLDVVATFKALKKTKFPADGAMSLEYEDHKDAPVPNIKKCFAVAAEAAKQIRGKGKKKA